MFRGIRFLCFIERKLNIEEHRYKHLYEEGHTNINTLYAKYIKHDTKITIKLKKKFTFDDSDRD